jgi:hypothetical protein
MHAMMLKAVGAALEWTDLADRHPGPGEIRKSWSDWAALAAVSRCPP